MRTPIPRRTPSGHADAVGVIVALLDRYPQIATLNSDPLDGSVTLSFAIAGGLDATIERELRETLGDHVRGLLALMRDEPDRLTVVVDADPELSFVRLTRDARSLTREELSMTAVLLEARFGDRLVRSAPAAVTDPGEDPAAQDEVVEYALDALRDPASPRSLVGFREEMRVVVYVVRRKKRTRARS